MTASAPTPKVIHDKRYKWKVSQKFPARLRITYREKDKTIQKYCSIKNHISNFNFSEDEWSKIQSKKGDFKDIGFEIGEIENKAHNIIKKISPFSFEAFRKKFENYSDSRILATAFTEYADSLRSKGFIGTAINYECARESFKKFQPDAILTDVTLGFLNSYKLSMINQGKKVNTVGMYLRALRHIINVAIKDNDLPREPYAFDGFDIPGSVNKKRALSEDEMRMIYEYNAEGLRGYARDFWYFLYLCNGFNTYDACLLKYSDVDFEAERITFTRKKTLYTDREQVTIEAYLNDDMKQIISKWGNENKSDNYVFKVLENGLSPEREKQLVQQHTKWVNNHMKKIAEDLKIKKKTCSTQYARHTFANTMLKNGTGAEMIGELMGHKDLKTTKKYLSGFDFEAKKAKTATLTNFKNKTGTK